MGIRNTIEALAKKYGDDTAYKFWKRTGLSQTTAYRLYQNRDAIPSEPAMTAICQAYDVQPGDFLEYVPTQESPENRLQS